MLTEQGCPVDGAVQGGAKPWWVQAAAGTKRLPLVLFVFLGQPPVSGVTAGVGK
ncbi:hypothetical protein ABZ471_44410 [Streptomyces sp. NPDC005728]|uniref:hypothetical protein n=1 Tax=Streptomyces sp. NPDC005728 TaxID=3157054 RepID=UPI0033CB8F36